MWKMMSKSHKKKLLKSKELGMRVAKENQLVEHCFSFWFRSFNTLKSKEAKVSQKHATLVKRAILKNWLS